MKWLQTNEGEYLNLDKVLKLGVCANDESVAEDKDSHIAYAVANRQHEEIIYVLLVGTEAACEAFITGTVSTTS